jgi:membrane-associated protease RseP (regulator of RpoE activity)
MIIVFLVSLFICIFLHELAHLLVAKLVKCEVEVFSIGFGKAIFKKKIGKTIFKIAWIPLGGYCQLKGELTKTRSKNAFTNLLYRKKLMILIAGVVINIITGLVAFLLGRIYNLHYLIYFGCISVFLGISNWFIPIPCLDRGYALWYLILTKIYGKTRGIKIFAKTVRISFIIVMALNIACIPYLITLIIRGAL